MSTYGKIGAISAALLSVVLFASQAHADQPPFARHLAMRIVIDGSGLLDMTSSEDIDIRESSIVRELGQIVLPVNEHYFDLEITEAATIKADGRHIAVAPDKILTAALPNAPMLGMFQADVKVRTIVFPDVAVGDTVHYVTRLRQTKPMLVGGTSLVPTFPASMRFQDVSISIDAPATGTFAAAEGFTETVETHGDRRITTWTMVPLPYRAEEPHSTASLDRDPRLTFSTWADWGAIGRAFLAETAPTSEPTAEIRALADKITDGITDRREQTRRIYEWVTGNVRYFGIFLGQGGLVPHSAASVLANKYGDCKDHATLMRALLAAKGISADFVLINLQSVYRGYDVAAMQWFNHVILHVPELDLWVDPTTSRTAFGVLPEVDSDKPVLRMSTNGVELTRTPPLSPQTNRLAVAVDATLRPDGTVAGRAVTTGAGAIATHLREAAARVAVKGGANVARELLTAQNWHGTGTIEARSSSDLTEPYVLTASFDLTDRFFGEEQGGRTLPYGPRLVYPAFAPIDAFLRQKRTQAFTCDAETWDQTIDLHLPETPALAKIPKDVAIDMPLAGYRSSYRLENHVLHSVRHFELRVAGRRCTPETAQQLAAVVEALRKDIETRLRFAESAETDAH